MAGLLTCSMFHHQFLNLKGSKLSPLFYFCSDGWTCHHQILFGYESRKYQSVTLRKRKIVNPPLMFPWKKDGHGVEGVGEDVVA